MEIPATMEMAAGTPDLYTGLENTGAAIIGTMINGGIPG